MDLGGHTLNNSGIVADDMITKSLWRRVAIGHAVVAHANVRLLNLYSKVFNGLAYNPPVVVCSMITSSIL